MHFGLIDGLLFLGKGEVLRVDLRQICVRFLVPPLCLCLIMSEVVYEMRHTLWLISVYK